MADPVTASTSEVLAGDMFYLVHKEIEALLSCPIETISGEINDSRRTHFYSINAADLSTSRNGVPLDSNALWKIESDSMDWAGQPVEMSVKKPISYRMMNIATGRYLVALTVTMPAGVIMTVSVSVSVSVTVSVTVMVTLILIAAGHYLAAKNVEGAKQA